MRVRGQKEKEALLPLRRAWVWSENSTNPGICSTMVRAPSSRLWPSLTLLLSTIMYWLLYVPAITMSTKRKRKSYSISSSMYLLFTAVNKASDLPELYLEKILAHSSPLCAKLWASLTLCHANKLLEVILSKREELKIMLLVCVIIRPLPNR